MASRSRALMVLHLRNGVQAYVNDIQMGIALVKQLQSEPANSAPVSLASTRRSGSLSPAPSSKATSSSTSSTRSASMSQSTSPPQQSTTASRSSGHSHSYSRGEISSQKGQLPVKNAFIHFPLESSESATSVASAPPGIGCSDRGRVQHQERTDSPGEHVVFDIFESVESKDAEVQVEKTAISTAIQTTSTETVSISTESIARTESSAQTDVLQAEVEYYKGLNGTWITKPSLPIGGVVEVHQPATSGERLPTQLPKGLRGLIVDIDKDLDYIVYFPELTLNGYPTKRIVLQEDTCKLRLLQQPGA